MTTAISSGHAVVFLGRYLGRKIAKNAPLVHVVDGDVSRRAAIARILTGFGYLVPSQEDFPGFSERGQYNGVILVSHPDSDKVLRGRGDGTLQLPVIVYAETPTVRQIVEAMRAGAFSYFEWPVSEDLLKHEIDRAQAAEGLIPADFRRRELAKDKVRSLTGRELDVLDGLLRWGSNKRIAHALGISPRTVELHRASAMRKIGARSTADAVQIAVCAGMGDADREW